MLEPSRGPKGEAPWLSSLPHLALNNIHGHGLQNPMCSDSRLISYHPPLHSLHVLHFLNTARCLHRRAFALTVTSACDILPRCPPSSLLRRHLLRGARPAPQLNCPLVAPCSLTHFNFSFKQL